MPTLVETRWVYMFDAAFWAIKNKDLINAILTENPNHAIKKYLKKKRFSVFKSGIPIVIEEIALIMLPIKAFFDKIESDKAALWWIKPLFQQLIDHLKSVEDNVDILSNECKLIRNQIETDYYAFARTELIETAYAFTSIGRKEYREIFFDKHIDDEQKQYPLIPQIDLSKYLELISDDQKDLIFSEFSFFNSKSESSDDEDLKNDEEEDKDIKIEEEEEEESFDANESQILESTSQVQRQTHKQKTLSDYYLDTISDVITLDSNQDEIQNANQTQTLNQFQKDHIKKPLKHWNQINQMKKESFYQCSLYCIKEILQCKNYDSEKREKVIMQFNNFFQYSCELLPNGDLLYNSNIEFWIAAKYSNMMSDIAEIALLFCHCLQHNQFVKGIYQ